MCSHKRGGFNICVLSQCKTTVTYINQCSNYKGTIHGFYSVQKYLSHSLFINRHSKIVEKYVFTSVPLWTTLLIYDLKSFLARFND